MATTFIDYNRDKGFWIAEIYMELTYEYILQALNNINEKISIREELEDDINFNITGLAKGMLTLTWQSFLKDKDQESEMIFVLEETKKLLNSKEEFISVRELNSYENKKEDVASKWPKPIKTLEVIKIVDALILMLKNEWNKPSNYEMDIEYSFV
ncbi:hypothetical protein [Tenacibaculum sp. 190524A05c]|uniref:hypothetical protein n=1 Tax=Tenacibaculum platacis TaxID=3137852 RepID=UPI0032B1A3F7